MDTSFPTKKIALFLTATLCFSFLVLAGISTSITGNHRIVYGVMSENSRLEGMSEKEALNYFEDTGKLKLAHKAIHLTYGQKSWAISPEDIGMTPNAKEAADAAYAIGRNGDGWFQNLISQIKCAWNGYHIDMDASYDEARLLAKVEAIASEIYTDPVNAYCSLNGDGSVQVIAGVVGKKLNAEELCDALAPSLKAFEFPTLELQPEEQQPFVRTEDIIDINSVLGSYTTHFYPGDRGDNIAIAASHLNSVLVRTGETFSFNNTVGPRTAAAGYKDAGVIIDGRMITCGTLEEVCNGMTLEDRFFEIYKEVKGGEE